MKKIIKKNNRSTSLLKYFFTILTATMLLWSCAGGPMDPEEGPELPAPLPISGE